MAVRPPRPPARPMAADTAAAAVGSLARPLGGREAGMTRPRGAGAGPHVKGEVDVTHTLSPHSGPSVARPSPGGLGDPSPRKVDTRPLAKSQTEDTSLAEARPRQGPRTAPRARGQPCFLPGRPAALRLTEHHTPAGEALEQPESAQASSQLPPAASKRPRAARPLCTRPLSCAVTGVRGSDSQCARPHTRTQFAPS